MCCGASSWHPCLPQTAHRHRRGKPGAEPKDWKIGDIVTYLPKACGTVSRGLGPRRITCKVVGKKGRGSITYYTLRSNDGVLDTQPRAAELQLAVPDTAAEINFDGVETEGVATVSETALARRGLAKPCKCRKQCNQRCPCKRRGAHCSRKCGCKCKVGANCGNH